MCNPFFKLGVLDQSPINEDETVSIAFQHTIQLAKKAEKTKNFIEMLLSKIDPDWKKPE